MMTMNRQRRILIAAFAVAGILFALIATHSRGSGFYYLLAEHPSAVPPVRIVFKLAGRERAFEAKLWLARAVLDGNASPPFVTRDEPSGVRVRLIPR